MTSHTPLRQEAAVQCRCSVSPRGYVASRRARDRSYPVKAFCAAATALSTSSTSLSGTVAQTLPVDGSKLSRWRSPAARLNWPSMKFSTWMRPSVAITRTSLVWRRLSNASNRCSPGQAGPTSQQLFSPRQHKPDLFSCRDVAFYDAMFVRLPLSASIFDL